MNCKIMATIAFFGLLQLIQVVHSLNTVCSVQINNGSLYCVFGASNPRDCVQYRHGFYDVAKCKDERSDDKGCRESIEGCSLNEDELSKACTSLRGVLYKNEDFMKLPGRCERLDTP